MLTISIGILIWCLSSVGNSLLTIAFGDSITGYSYLFPYVLVATAAIGVLFFVNDVLIIQRKMPQLFISNASALMMSFIGAVVMTHLLGMNGINLSIVIGAASGIALGMISILK